MRYLNRVLGVFRSEAVTVGLSPKALAPAIGAVVTALLAAAGVTPHEIGDWIGVSDAVVAAGEVTLAAKVAAYLLGPGTVVRPDPQVTDGNDARLSPESSDRIADLAPPAPAPAAPATIMVNRSAD